MSTIQVGEFGNVTPLRGGELPVRIAPYNTEAEQGLLGAILSKNAVYHRVAGFLEAEHFGNAVHARIYTAIGKMLDRGTVASPVTLKNAFDVELTLREVGGAQYLVRLAAAAAVYPEDYAKAIVDLAQRRKLIGELEERLEQAYEDFDASTGEIAGRLSNGVDQVWAGVPDRILGINPSTLEGLPVPKREFIVPGWVPTRRATGLYGVGGSGKSTLLQQLCASCALDPERFPHANWFGLPVQHCRSVLLYAEDELDEMHARQEEINRAYGCTFADLSDMLWLPRLGTDVTLMKFEGGEAIRTPAFYELLRIIRRHRARLTVWDTLTDIFGGNEIDRRQARQFVQEVPAYVAREIDGAVICAAHPSLAGISNGSGSSGSTGWDGAFRSRLYLSSPKEEDGDDAQQGTARVLTRVKSNWAQVGETIEMRWQEGVYLTDRPPTGIVGAIEKRTCERVFLDLLAKLAAQKRYVSDRVKAGNYAPKVFAMQPDREGFRAADFVRAQERLFGSHKIKMGTYRSSGHDYNCLVLADQLVEKK